MAQDGIFNKLCSQCGSTSARRLGECSVCGRTVCENCGSIQVTGGMRKPIHRECLKKADGHFKMIKFVR